MKCKKLISTVAALSLVAGLMQIPASVEAESASIMQSKTVGDITYNVYDFSTKANMQAVLNNQEEDGIGTAEYAYDSIYTNPITAVMSGDEIADDTAMVVTGLEDPQVSLGTELDAGTYPYVKLLYKYTEAAEGTAWVHYTGGEDAALWNPTVDGNWHTAVVNAEGGDADALMIGAMQSDDYDETTAMFKYVAMFKTEANANAYDASVKSATINGTEAEIDPFNYTITVTQDSAKVFADINKLSANNIAFSLMGGAAAQINTSTQTLTIDGNDNAVATVKATVTDITGASKTWTITEVTPIKKSYQVLDFSTCTKQIETDGAGVISKTTYDAYTDITYMAPQYAGPAVGFWTNGYYTQALFKFDQIDPKKDHYVKFVIKLPSCNVQPGRTADCQLFVDWRNASANNAITQWSSDYLRANYDTDMKGQWFTFTGKIPAAPKEEERKLRILFNGMQLRNYALKYVALFDTEAEAKAFDPSVISGEIDGQNAVVDPFKHTVTLNYPEGTTADQMGALSAQNISYTLYNNMATMFNSTLTPAESSKVVENEDETAVVLNCNVTNLQGDTIVWKFKKVAKKDASQKTYFVHMFDSISEINAMIEDGTVTREGQATVAARPLDYNGPYLNMRSENSDYTQAVIHFEDANPNKTYYAKILYNAQNLTWRASGAACTCIAWTWNNRSAGNEYQHWWASGAEAPEWQCKQWLEDVVRVPASTHWMNPNDKDILLLATARGVLGVKYIGLFETEEQANSYDASIKSAFIGYEEGQIDPFKHKIVFDAGDVDDLELKFIHEDVDVAATAAHNDNAKTVSAEKLGDAVVEDNGCVKQKYTVHGLAGDVVWTVQIGESLVSDEPSVAITSEDSDITATFANAEGLGAKILALYNKTTGTLVDVEVSGNSETVELNDVAAGEYVAKAFIWNSLSAMEPTFEAYPTDVTIQ